MKNEKVGYKYRDVFVAIPKAWRPDTSILKSLSGIAQLTLNRLNLGGRGITVEFDTDARVSIEENDVHSSGSTATIFVHPANKHRICGWATNKETAQTVAQAAAVNGFVGRHPDANDRQVKAVSLRAGRVARDVMKELLVQSPAPKRTIIGSLFKRFK